MQHPGRGRKKGDTVKPLLSARNRGIAPVHTIPPRTDTPSASENEHETKPAALPVTIVPADHETNVEEEPRVVVKTVLDVVGFTRGREAGIKEGFADGIHYIVRLAEVNLVKSLKLPDRHALGQSGQLPGWWVLTLVKALGIEDLPDDIALDPPIYQAGE